MTALILAHPLVAVIIACLTGAVLTVLTVFTVLAIALLSANSRNEAIETLLTNAREAAFYRGYDLGYDCGRKHAVNPPSISDKQIQRVRELHRERRKRHLNTLAATDLSSAHPDPA